MVPYLGDLWLHPGPAVIHGSAVERSEPESAALVEAQGVGVVVRRDHPEPVAAGVRRQPLDGLYQRTARPEKGLGSVQGEDLALVVAEHEREHADECAVALRHERRVFQRVLEPAQSGHVKCGPFGKEDLDRVLVAPLAATDVQLGQRQAARARSTIASACTEGGSIP